jgi:hypothetical protein
LSCVICCAALLTRTSIRPNSATAVSMTDRQCSASARSPAQHRLAAGLLYPAGGLPRIIVLVEVGDEHVGAFPGKRDRHGPPNAAIRASDHGGLASQPPRPPVALLAVIRLRVHLAGPARRLLLLRWLVHDFPSAAAEARPVSGATGPVPLS